MHSILFWRRVALMLRMHYVSHWMLGTLKYRINGGGVGIIGGLEMVRDNNNWGGWNNRGGGLLGEIENSPFLR